MGPWHKSRVLGLAGVQTDFWSVWFKAALDGQPASQFLVLAGQFFRINKTPSDGDRDGPGPCSECISPGELLRLVNTDLKFTIDLSQPVLNAPLRQVTPASYGLVGQAQRNIQEGFILRVCQSRILAAGLLLNASDSWINPALLFN